MVTQELRWVLLDIPLTQKTSASVSVSKMSVERSLRKSWHILNVVIEIAVKENKYTYEWHVWAVTWHKTYTLLQ